MSLLPCTPQNTSCRIAAGAAIILLLLMPALTATAQNNSTTVAVGGQRLPVNGTTGQLERLTPEQAAALRQTLSRLLNHSTEGLTVVQHLRGYEYVDLQGRFLSVATIRHDADGKHVQCVSSLKEAEGQPARTAPQPSPKTSEQSAVGNPSDSRGEKQ